MKTKVYFCINLQHCENSSGRNCMGVLKFELNGSLLKPSVSLTKYLLITLSIRVAQTTLATSFAHPGSMVAVASYF